MSKIMFICKVVFIAFVTALILCLDMHNKKIHDLEARLTNIERFTYLPYRMNEAYARDEAIVEKQIEKMMEKGD